MVYLGWLRYRITFVEAGFDGRGPLSKIEKERTPHPLLFAVHLFA
jgi:hypothetical protein